MKWVSDGQSKSVESEQPKIETPVGVRASHVIKWRGANFAFRGISRKF